MLEIYDLMFLKKTQHLCVPEIIDLSVTSVVFLIPTSVSGREVQTGESILLYLSDSKKLPEFASDTHYFYKSTWDLKNILAYYRTGKNSEAIINMVYKY